MIEFVITLLGAIALLALVGMKLCRVIDDPRQGKLVGLLLTAGRMYRDDPVTVISDVMAYFRAFRSRGEWRMSYHS